MFWAEQRAEEKIKKKAFGNLSFVLLITVRKLIFLSEFQFPLHHTGGMMVD